MQTLRRDADGPPLPDGELLRYDDGDVVYLGGLGAVAAPGPWHWEELLRADLMVGTTIKSAMIGRSIFGPPGLRRAPEAPGTDPARKIVQGC